MVCQPSGAFDCGALEDSRPQNLPHAGTSISSQPSVATTSRLEVERRRLVEDQLSARVISTIQAARRPSTRRIYDATWSMFSKWCTRKGTNPLSPSLAQLLEFLQDSLDRGLSPNTLRRQVAAQASVIRWKGYKSISHHPSVKNFLRGATNLSPPVIHWYPHGI
uniref:Core-binding (CB) domain-containing protein n=1 Tax=Micrurus lemniscatus lemniscatus TaxID=129467 RepID=A0A2D4J4Y7_MICLE